MKQILCLTFGLLLSTPFMAFVQSGPAEARCIEWRKGRCVFYSTRKNSRSYHGVNRRKKRDRGWVRRGRKEDSYRAYRSNGYYPPRRNTGDYYRD